MAIDQRTAKFMARQSSPKFAGVLISELNAASAADTQALEREDASLTDTSVATTNQTATPNEITKFNATAGSLTLTAFAPSVGATFGGQLTTTASAHTLSILPAGSETFDGNADGVVLTVAGTQHVYTSIDGINWVTAS
jgi:hypothetical protein